MNKGIHNVFQRQTAGGDDIVSFGRMYVMNIIALWCIAMPLSFMAAFWWKLPVVWVVLCIQSDQIFKCLPVFIHFRKYNWIIKRTQDIEAGTTQAEG